MSTSTTDESVPFDEKRISVPVRSGGNVMGILTTPKTFISEPGPGTRIIVIAHGFGGHKDYCYQKMLAHGLASDLGLSSFRFDFRNCGDSSDVPNTAEGRTIMGTDQEDLDAVIFDYLIGNRKFVLAGIVSHSRGSVAMFQWAVRNQDRITIPSLVNCSGRFRSELFIERIRSVNPNFDRDGGMTAKALRHGQFQDLWFPANEVITGAQIDMSVISQIKCPVLSVYGLDDEIIPLEDINYFSEALGYHRHQLRVLEGANHNFYQLDPETGKKLDNHNPRVVDIVTEWYSPERERERFLRDFGVVGTIPRWKKVEGVSNLRDFGGLYNRNGNYVRPELLYRSANPAHTTEYGYEQMEHELNIRTIFDLRSIQELERNGSASDHGKIKVQWTPIFKDQDLSPEKLANRHNHYKSDPVEGFKHAYREILDTAGPAYRQIMLHLRDRPNEGVLIHCTAGKDRTGLICALILLLAGVDGDIVSREYELTTEGLRDELPRLRSSVDENLDAEQAKGMLNMLSSKYDAMRVTIAMIEDVYGGPEGYFKTQCGLDDNDIATIRSNLIANPSSRYYWHH
uniref:ARAD1D13134p n=1 Tax=Blastobotrys adeninivorans TaxID=409370 RepID=A0A060T9N1_BLAAD